MKRGIAAFAATALLLLTGALFAQAQEMDPLLKILVENKVITMEQALSVQAEYARRQQAAQAPAPPAPQAPAGVTKEEAARIAQEAVAKAKPELPEPLKDLKVGGTLFLSYQVGNGFDATRTLASGRYVVMPYSQFILKRGYLDVEKKITGWLDARITPDIRQDAAGNWFYRAKFLYARFHWKGNALFTQPYVMAGSVPTPYLDFEESVYYFRAQDPLFLDRNGVISSADLGVVGGSNLGPELPESYRKEVNSKFAGRYGSFAVGLFNGGGYETAEKNVNKTAMARLSLRPFPDQAPGFQVTVFAGRGKGNLPEVWATSGPYKGTHVYPEYTMLMGLLTYERRGFAATAQWYDGHGNRLGTALAPDFSARHQEGLSLFARVGLLTEGKFCGFVRYDSFDTDARLISAQSDQTERWIAGLSYTFFKNDMLLLDYDSLHHSLSTIPRENRWQLTLQLKF